MEANIYIHGVPYGFKYCGDNTKEKDIFFARYYNHFRHIDEMRIEMTISSGKQYFYYTYILGENVFDYKNNRAGSYFAITIRLNAYYKRATNFYYLLDSIFHSYIEKDFINSDKNNYKFLVESVDEIYNKIYKDTQTLIGNTISEHDISSYIKDVKTTNEYSKISLSDASNDFVLECLKKYGEVSISKSYTSIKIEEAKLQYEASIKNIKTQVESDFNQKENEIKLQMSKCKEVTNSYKNNIESLEDSVNTLKTREIEYKELINNIIAEINKFHYKNDIDTKNQKINEVNPSISKDKNIIDANLEEIGSQNNNIDRSNSVEAENNHHKITNNKSGSINKILRFCSQNYLEIINLILLVIICCILYNQQKTIIFKIHHM